VSTRTRIVLVQEGIRTYTGVRALTYLTKLCMDNPVFNVALLQVPGISRSAKLEYLARTKLPAGWYLYICQEPKRTRITRSLYQRIIQRGGVL